MITLRQYLSAGNIFTELSSIGNFPVIDGNETLLNTMLKVNYGDAILFEPYQDIDLSEVAEMINVLLSDKWMKLYEVDYSNINLASNNSNVQTTTNEFNETGSNDVEMLNKVSSYNDDALLTDTGSTNNGVDTKTGDSTTTNVNENISFNALNENLKYLSDLNIIKTIQSDIKQLLTISIY